MIEDFLHTLLNELCTLEVGFVECCVEVLVKIGRTGVVDLFNAAVDGNDVRLQHLEESIPHSLYKILILRSYLLEGQVVL